ncbi:alpha/beta hydrolase [Gramella sp. BOM4]|nr:alpha/beta hydrolase [Christiangramia bathymodioli]
MKKSIWIPGLILLILAIGYFSGPVPKEPTYSYDLPELPSDIKKLESYIDKQEQAKPVREDNEARIMWFQEKPVKTEFSIVYLHGFAGSYMDGYPVNKIVADTLKANLYLSRWAGHGLRAPHSLNSFSPEEAWESAKEALMIGNRIGEKTIILSTSTGGTLATKLAAAYPDMVHALINLSPNFEDDQPGTFVLNSPWGYDIARIVSFGENKKIDHEQEIATQYWDTIYPSRALVDLQLLVDSTMRPAVFEKVECPVLTLYYHENFLEEDQHVEVSVYDEYHRQFSTPDSLNVLKALDTPGTHFIGSDIKSKDTEVVVKAIVQFLSERMNIEL